MSLYDCDHDGGVFLGYAERIQLSDGSVTCCESGLVIPSGVPYALCRLAFCQGSTCDVEGCNGPSPATILQGDPHWEEHCQALEVWRFLRRNRFKNGACAPFGYALEAYKLEYDESEVKADLWLYLSFVRVIKKARARYDAGRSLSLRPEEQASLDSGQWVHVLGDAQMGVLGG